MNPPANRYGLWLTDSDGNTHARYHGLTWAEAWAKFDTLESVVAGRTVVVEYVEVPR